MNKKLLVGIMVTILTLTGAGVALAKNTKHFGNNLFQSRLDAEAKILGITTQDLSSQLKVGKTFEQIAQNKGINADQLSELMHKLSTDQTKQRLDQLVANGKITRAQADSQLAWLEQKYQWMKLNPPPLKQKDLMLNGGGKRAMPKVGGKAKNR